MLTTIVIQLLNVLKELALIIVHRVTVAKLDRNPKAKVMQKKENPRFVEIGRL